MPASKRAAGGRARRCAPGECLLGEPAFSAERGESLGEGYGVTHTQISSYYSTPTSANQYLDDNDEKAVVRTVIDPVLLRHEARRYAPAS